MGLGLWDLWWDLDCGTYGGTWTVGLIGGTWTVGLIGGTWVAG